MLGIHSQIRKIHWNTLKECKIIYYWIDLLYQTQSTVYEVNPLVLALPAHTDQMHHISHSFELSNQILKTDAVA